MASELYGNQKWTTSLSRHLFTHKPTNNDWYKMDDHQQRIAWFFPFVQFTYKLCESSSSRLRLHLPLVLPYARTPLIVRQMSDELCAKMKQTMFPITIFVVGVAFEANQSENDWDPLAINLFTHNQINWSFSPKSFNNLKQVLNDRKSVANFHAEMSTIKCQSILDLSN